MVCVTEELNLKPHLISVNLILNSHMLQMATILNSTGPRHIYFVAEQCATENMQSSGYFFNMSSFMMEL